MCQSCIDDHYTSLKKLFRDAQRDLNASGAGLNDQQLSAFLREDASKSVLDGIIGGGLMHKQFLDLFDLWAENPSFRPKMANTTPGQPLTEQVASVLFPNARSTRSSGPSVNPSAAVSSVSIDSFTSSQTPSYPTSPIFQHHLTSSGDFSWRSSLQSLAFQMAGIFITTPHPAGISSAPPDVSAQANRSSTSVTSWKSSHYRLSTAASSTVGQSSGEASMSKRPRLEDSPAHEREHTCHMAKSAETVAKAAEKTAHYNYATSRHNLEILQTLVNGGASLEGIDVNRLLVPPIVVPAIASPAPAPDLASIHAPLPPSPLAPIHALLPLSPLPLSTPAPIHAPLPPPTPALISPFQGFAYVTPTADMSRGWAAATTAATPGSSGAQAWTTPQVPVQVIPLGWMSPAPQQLPAWPVSPRMSQASPSIYYTSMPPAIYQPVPAYPGQNHASDIIAASSSADTSNSVHAYTAENVNAYTANAYAAQNINALYAAQNVNTSYAAQNINASTAQNINAYTAQNTENTNAYNTENINTYAARGINAHTIGGVTKNVNLYAAQGIDAHTIGGVAENVNPYAAQGINAHTIRGVDEHAGGGIDMHTVGGVDAHAGGGVDAHIVGGVDTHTVRGVNVHMVEDFVHIRFV
ncbi:hypothetical protein OBBRIDRAFT_804333 [Obba rivulosa]|uniref:Uncharacterized protein n=1 Tax=Obba rivulosa TaxID=1052685 RepID=A0A8E2ARZ6_9APHY|nr:hypothetical protein OBBRIDRAFT_804333 [Obba rivulosa]